jgi:FkbM family methyltransferase
MNNHLSLLKKGLRPMVRLLQAIAKRSTNIRYFNGQRIKMPWRVRHLFSPIRDHNYETEEWEALWKIGEPGQSFLDIGANIGIITAAMSMIAGPKGKVIACEPNPATYCLLVELLRLNQCINTLPLQILVLEEYGISKFFLSEFMSLGVMSAIVANDPYSKEIMIPAVTIDALSEYGRPFHYIKIDAEGSEYKILMGSRRTLERWRPVVQVEIHGQYIKNIGGTVELLFQFMQERSYKCINIPTWSEVDSHEYLSCTHCHAPEPFTGRDMAYQGYGQVAFVPSEKGDILARITRRPCTICQK